ncbi:MAG: dihydroxy-acid dehydratase, partial [Trueperaceae bacterium]
MTRTKKNAEELRSHRWFGTRNLRSFGHHSRMQQMGYHVDEYRGKPVIGILNTWSDLNPCHLHFKQRVEDVKRGVWQAGGFPVELPAIALSENIMKPTTMLYRNLLAMETEELLRAHPIDGAVLMGGCDKTTPALIMGTTTMDLPFVLVPAGPMLRGNWRGETLGSGSDSWKYWDELRAGNIDDQAWSEVETGIARSFGTCMTMGTASTMTSVVEAMGLTLPGASSIPAPDANHPRMANASGRTIVEMVWNDLRPGELITEASIDNGIVTTMALGGSTNAIIHLIAMAGRAGIALDLD